MANDSRRVSQLNITTTLSANDRVLVLTNPASNTPNTQTITFNNLGVLMANTFLPIANTTNRGVVKVDGVTINVSTNGTLSAILAGNLTPGIVQPDNSTTTVSNGVISAITATNTSLGIVKPDGVTISISNGVITAVGNTAEYTVTYVNHATYMVTSEDKILFADPNAVGGNITIIFNANTNVAGKEFLVKNINPSGQYRVRVTTQDGISANTAEIEDPVTGNIVVYYDMYGPGEGEDWIYDGAVYRHTGTLRSAPIFYTSANTYHQVVITNKSNGVDASSDLVLYNDQGSYINGTGPFIDVGIDSSTYSNSEYSIFSYNDAYVYSDNGNLSGGKMLIGTSQDTQIVFFTNGTTSDTFRFSINSTAVVSNVSVIPTNNTFNLGNSSNHWNALYVANAIISSNVEGDATGIDFYTPDTSSYIGMTYGPNPSSGNSSYLYWEKEGSGSSHFLGVQVWKGASDSWSQWTFGSNGSITFPDSSIQNTAYQIVKSGFNVQYPSIRMDNVMFSIDNAGHPTVGAISGTWEGPWEAEARLWDGTSSFVTTSHGSTSTTWTSIASYGIGVTFGHPGDRVTGTFTNGTNGHIYRVTWIATASGPSTGYGFIIIEKLV